MKILKTILKEPLTQFLIFGGFLFFIYQKTAHIFNPTELVINKDDLIEYMQYQANGFNKTTFEQKYAALPQEEKQKILDEYTTEAVLVREAKRLNIHENDNVIKKRLIQKVKFILKNDNDEEPTDAALKDFYDNHRDQYSANEKYSFSHVFFSFTQHTEQEALKLTQDFIEKSKLKFIKSEDALAFSDRFPYYHHYIQRDLSFIQSNFSNDFTQKLVQLPVNAGLWQGAIQSNLGYHAVLLFGKDMSSIKPFEQVKDLVKADYINDRNEAALQSKIKQLKKQYNVQFIE